MSRSRTNKDRILDLLIEKVSLVISYKLEATSMKEEQLIERIVLNPKVMVDKSAPNIPCSYGISRTAKEKI
jgi:hypothetical protein